MLRFFCCYSFLFSDQIDFFDYLNDKIKLPVITTVFLFYYNQKAEAPHRYAFERSVANEVPHGFIAELIIFCKGYKHVIKDINIL